MFHSKHKKHDWSNDGSFVSRPKHGWLHENELLHPDVGISYAVKYTGSVAVLESMRALDFDTRTAITNESINRLCHGLGAKGSQKFKKNHKLDKFLGPHLNFSTTNDVILTITTESLTISDSASRELIHQHMMPSISFASGGEPETQDFVAYVAKGDVGRCCYVLECNGGLARDVITTIGQAFEIRFKNYLSHKAAPLTVPDCIPTATIEAEYYNDRPDVQPPSPELRHSFCERGSNDVDAFAHSHHHQQHHHHHHHHRQHHHHHHHDNDNREVERFPSIPNEYQYPKSNQPVRSESERGFEQGRNLTSSSSSSSQDIQSGRSLESFQLGSTVDSGVHVLSSSRLSPYHEIWFHGKISRKRSEDLLLRSGDFLVRESPNSPGQFVLSGRQGGCMKHLLLVDPEGKVRTKDQLFNSVSHLVNYHQYNQVPIISNDSELLLINPIHCTLQQF